MFSQLLGQWVLPETSPKFTTVLTRENFPRRWTYSETRLLPDSFKFVAFLRFCKWREKVPKMGKCSKMGIFSPKGENIHLWGKCSPKRENFHVQWNFPNYLENRENLPLQTFRGEYFPSKIPSGIFSLKNFRGEYFPQFSSEYFWGTSQKDTFVCRYGKRLK